MAKAISKKATKEKLDARKRQIANSTAMGDLIKRLDESKDYELRTYGFDKIQGLTQLQYEMLSFVAYKGLQKAKCTRFDNFRNIVSILWPKIEWNIWLERQIQSLCDNQFVSWTGCAASGKTFAGALYSTVWWICQPDVSAAVLTSTTKGMLRKRMWSEVQKLYTSMEWNPPGNMVDSKTVWQAVKGDEKNAIFGLAVKDGNTAAAVGHIQGIHTSRVLIVIDEATDTPQAIFDATANLYAGCEQFQMLVIGNPNSHYDPHGKFSEPKDGWNSVTVETEDWETQIQLNGEPGYCVRFDAERSPNIIAGKTTYKYLMTEHQLEGSRRKYGPESPLFWKFYRGFWAPSGVLKTVFNETLLSKMEAHLGFLFRREIKVIGACDPAFGGGDRAVLRFAVVGVIDDGKPGIELELFEELEIDASSEEPVHFQLAAQIQSKCEERGCKPEDFGIDASGEGGGLADILAKQWSPRINRVEFGGAASDLPVSSEDLRPAKEVYDRRVTELWFTAREYLQSGQLRGIDPWTAKEFCSREFEDERRKLKLQTKRDMKAVYGMSPDIADCTVILTEVAKRSGIGVYIADHVREQDTDEFVDLTNAVYDDIGDEFDDLDAPV
jgi:hypothetical protein|tara:strand:- start:613 stop:2442 length:1830 start_codon:yes stop_codon:yes gene_type:complete